MWLGTVLAEMASRGRDKITYALLEATLGEYAAGRAARTVPVMRMILAAPEELQERCVRVRAAVAARTALLHVDVADGASTVGGGTTPGLELPTCVLAVTTSGLSPDEIEARLRQNDPPVVGRIENDRVLLDLRTVLPEQDHLVAEALLGLSA